MNTTKKNTSTMRQSMVASTAAVVALFAFHVSDLDAAGIVVGHDVNTLGSNVAGTAEATFAVNVATFLTSDRPTKALLLFESAPGDGNRNFAPGVLTALTNAGFNVTVTPDYTKPFSSFDAVFVSMRWPSIGFLDNPTLTSYVNSGGGVYLAGGVGAAASSDAGGWNNFLNSFGLSYDASAYNPLTNVNITSTHPIFAGVSNLGCGFGSSILNLGTNPDAQIVQSVSGKGVYAVVPVPEPSGLALLCIGGISFLASRQQLRAARSRQ